MESNIDYNVGVVDSVGADVQKLIDRDRVALSFVVACGNFLQALSSTRGCSMQLHECIPPSDVLAVLTTQMTEIGVYFAVLHYVS
ncbi:hypothetical protein PsorP6_003031 [Peronosclerospora sorghi]|uniref:Uncharacterized protein n=1 Tax=Peronosclerospora sorghi TaxID=230839 RepID=A0ACC0VTI8_9STRA|nr:hypothetical protein PsorP6_003031 [Peronosclerospora sorghi]